MPDPSTLPRVRDGDLATIRITTAGLGPGGTVDSVTIADWEGRSAVYVVMEEPKPESFVYDPDHPPTIAY